MGILSRLEKILKIVKNYIGPTVCEHEESFFEHRICIKYFKNPNGALDCYKKENKEPRFFKSNKKDYLLCCKN